MILYFDTSALVKLIVAEEGSSVADELWTSSNPAASSIFSYPEGRAALGAALRAGRLTPAAHKSALAEFESIQGKLSRIAVDAQLASQAGDLAERFALRGYDAVHLASALSASGPVTLVTWDSDLRSAAEQNGCAIAPAN
ncbi:MAG: type II toxin-antitoxin system VapC family toxin [Solirubrobacteraceae bacterium]